MDWIRKNKLSILLLTIILFLLFRGSFLRFFGAKTRRAPTYPAPAEFGETTTPLSDLRKKILPPPIPREYSPTERKERLLVKESSMSLVVSRVQETAEQIIKHTRQAGGFLVSSSLTHPTEAPFATIVVRVPTRHLRKTIKYFRSLAVKVSSERISGTDVTDEYVDIETRLATLQKTKARFESMMDQATSLDQILKVQKEIINLQDQIDRLKGRKKYLEQTAKLAKITLYLSTDELALPYTPAKPFRPKAIFRRAVRSLIRTLRTFVALLIWVGVYAVIWLPILLVFLWIKRRKRK